METDWLAFEGKLADLLEADLLRFAQEHQDETFYSLALDCNAAYCDILMSANTPDALRVAASRYAEDQSAGSIHAAEEVLRWGLGDWKYHGFNLKDPDDRKRYRSVLPGGDELHSSEECERFLIAACRAILTIERRNVLATLSKTKDFRLACIDHDEDFASGAARLERARAVA
jgi:hypothetical protein